MSPVEKRWNEAAAAARERGLGEVRMATLARSLGLEWLRGRDDDMLSDFVNAPGRRVMSLRGLGTKRLGLLCEIVERASCMADPPRILAELGLPEDYPCKLMPFSKRIHIYCAGRNLVGIGELLDEWQRLGAEKFLAMPRFGKKRVAELEAFFGGLRPGRYQELASFLPLNESGCGLSLRRALAMILERKSIEERVLIHRRLVDQVSLHQAGRLIFVGGARAGQIMGKFLNEVRSVLDYFSEDRRRLANAAVNAENGLEILCEVQPGRYGILFGRALEVVLRSEGRVEVIGPASPFGYPSPRQAFRRRCAMPG